MKYYSIVNNSSHFHLISLFWQLLEQNLLHVCLYYWNGYQLGYTGPKSDSISPQIMNESGSVTFGLAMVEPFFRHDTLCKWSFVMSHLCPPSPKYINFWKHTLVCSHHELSLTRPKFDLNSVWTQFQFSLQLTHGLLTLNYKPMFLNWAKFRLSSGWEYGWNR